MTLQDLQEQYIGAMSQYGKLISLERDRTSDICSAKFVDRSGVPTYKDRSSLQAMKNFLLTL